MNDVDWNDLRFVLAVVRSKSAAAAARAMGVSHATVLRRIQQLEKKLGVLIFARHSSGYIPTATGLSLGELALSIENSLAETSLTLDAESNDLAGRIRFTTTDSLAIYLLPPILADFARQYPQIQVDLMVTNNLLDLDKLDADVSLRICSNPPGNWIGRRLTRLDCGVYATSNYLATKNITFNNHSIKDTAFSELEWIMPCGPLANARIAEWLPTEIENPKFTLMADSFLAIEKLVSQGVAAAVLPVFIANSGGNLTQVCLLPKSYSNDVWLLTLPHMKGISRVKLFTNHLVDSVKFLQHELEDKSYLVKQV